MKANNSKREKNIKINSDEQISRKIHAQEILISLPPPFKDKVIHAKTKIKDFLTWCNNEYYKDKNDWTEKEVLVSFSGGKDSTVLLDLVLQVANELKYKLKIVPGYAIEITFPETIKFIKNTIQKYQKKYDFLSNPLLIPPKKPWLEILHQKGYPIFSKQISVMINRLKRLNKKTGLAKWAFGIEPSSRYKISRSRLFLLDKKMTYYTNEKNEKIYYDFSEKCCDYVKGGLKHYKSPSFVGTMATESLLRRNSWIKNGCNVLNPNHPTSRPLSIWNSNDVWEYIKTYNIPVNPAYDYQKETHNIDNLRFSRLGCTACPLGSSIEDLVHKRMIRNTSEKISSNKKHWNRFEKLYEYNYGLYVSQVIKTGIRNILVDMDIKVRNDPEYETIYNKRRKEIDKWYKNFRKNFLLLLIELEHYPNRKENWEYSIDEINRALNHYNEKKLTKKEIEFIKLKRSEYISAK